MRTFLPTTLVAPSSEKWEAAYCRFETPEQEIAKFIQRLRRLGAEAWPRDAQIVELFCGRGNGLHALAALGFAGIEGIDFSQTLAERYRGKGRITVGDCRSLPWPDASKDVLIVQGGLHHLPDLEGDLARVLSEARRVLRPGGRFVVVEPWLTPFLQLVHAVAFSPLRRLSAKLDAFAALTELEQETYERWMTAPDQIRAQLTKNFDVERLSYRYGKIYFVGLKRPA